MSCFVQKASNASLTNSLPLSVSMPRKRKGRPTRRRSSASTTNELSRTSSATHSVHPLAMSVSTSVWAMLPAMVSPLCATRSASTKPGAGSFQSANVRTGTLPRRRGPFVRRVRRRPFPTRGSANTRSMVDALTRSSRSRTSASRRRCAVAFQRGQENRQQGLESLPADPVGRLPEHDERLAHRLVVDPTASSRRWSAPDSALVEQADGVLAVIARHRDELIQDLTFLVNRGGSIPLGQRLNQLAARRRADLGHVALLAAPCGSARCEATGTHPVASRANQRAPPVAAP